MMMERTTIFIKEEQRKNLRHLAIELNSTMSDLIRKAIDELLRKEHDNGYRKDG